MKVTATKEDIEQSAALLEMLNQWTDLKRIHNEYSRGCVTFSVDDASHKKRNVIVGTDAYSHRQVPIAETPVKRAQREIDTLVGTVAEKLAAQVCEIIKRNMPIPIE